MDVGNLKNQKLAKAEITGKEQEWEDYNCYLGILEINGEDTRRRAVIKDGEYVSIVSSRYKLLPNDHVRNVVESITEEEGLRLKSVKRQENRKIWIEILDPEAKLVHGHDEINVGAVISNSMDSRMRMRIQTMSWRQTCSNGAYGLIKGKKIGEQIHKGDIIVDREELKETILMTLQEATDFIDHYEEMALQIIDSEVATKLRNFLEDRYLPEWLEEFEEDVEEIEPNDLPDTESKFNVYNDITRNIWHRSKISPQTQNSKFQKLHKAMEIEV